ncbi:MAG: hypothetical protein RIC95_08040 [Vicingaceae bacterium]
MTKKDILNHLHFLLEQKINECQAAIKEVQSAMSAETKSSAGDKHETSREMMKQSRDQMEGQLGQYQKQIHQLKSLAQRKSQVVQAGSWVKTKKQSFFFGIALGRISLHNQTIFVVSAQAPLAIAFLGKKEGDKVSFRGEEYHIKSIQ